MKNVLLVLAACLFLSGCVTGHYRGADGSELSYTRWGPQKASDVVVESGDVKLKIGSQESNPTDLFLKGLELGKELAD